MPKTQSTPVDDEAAEHIAQWSQLPHPLEAAVLHEVNEPDESVMRAADLMHREPPGLVGPTRSTWVVVRLTPSGEGNRRRVANWCWYATKQAAEGAVRTGCSDDTLILHETSVPRSVRCEGIEAYLAKNYQARSAQPTH